MDRMERSSLDSASDRLALEHSRLYGSAGSYAPSGTVVPPAELSVTTPALYGVDTSPGRTTKIPVSSVESASSCISANLTTDLTRSASTTPAGSSSLNTPGASTHVPPPSGLTPGIAPGLSASGLPPSGLPPSGLIPTSYPSSLGRYFPHPSTSLAASKWAYISFMVSWVIYEELSNSKHYILCTFWKTWHLSLIVSFKFVVIGMEMVNFAGICHIQIM